MKYLVVILILTLASPQLAFEQSSPAKPKTIHQQKEEAPSPRQLDLMQRIQYDMTHPFGCIPFVAEAYGDKHQVAFQERVNEGLTNPRNLVDIIHHACLGETERVYYELHLFPSLTREEREHFLSLSNDDLEYTANKYARWIKQVIENEKRTKEQWE